MQIHSVGINNFKQTLENILLKAVNWPSEEGEEF